MKILFTHRYFWPDTPPYAAMLRFLTKEISDAGHDVHVFSSMPSYRGRSDEIVPKSQKLDGVSISRGPVFSYERKWFVLRFLNVALYCIALFIHIIKTKSDVVVAGTFPPVFAAWTASCASRIIKAKFYYHMQDIHPEVSRYSGGVLGRGFLFWVLQRLDNQSLKRATGIVVLSSDMANTIRGRNIGSSLNIKIIKNFSLTSDKTTEPPSYLRKQPGKTRVIFAGNLGRFQNLELLAQGISRCFPAHPELELLFLGDGDAEQALKDRWEGHSQVRFAPFLPFSEASSVIRESDIGIVSLVPNIYRVSCPSKMLTYLNLGVSLLMLVEPESEIAMETRKFDLGAVPESFTESAISSALLSLLSDPNRSSSLLEWVDNNISPEELVRDWLEFLELNEQTVS